MQPSSEYTTTMEFESDIRDSLTALKERASAGYAIALHIRLVTPAYLFQTYPKAWIDHYSQSGYVMRDPTVQWGFENTGVIGWSDLVANDPDGILAEAAAYGMTFGFTYVIDRHDSRSLSSFTSTKRMFTNDEIDGICARVDDMHDATVGLRSLSAGTRQALTKMSVIFTHP